MNNNQRIIDKIIKESIIDSQAIKDYKKYQKFKLLYDIKFYIHLKWLIFKNKLSKYRKNQQFF